MLAGEISDLAGLRLGIVAWRDLTTNVRIEMTQSRCAIPVGWNRLIMDMIHCASVMRKPRRRCRRRSCNLQNGPRDSLGRPVRKTLKNTPWAFGSQYDCLGLNYGVEWGKGSEKGTYGTIRIRRGRNVALNAATGGKTCVVCHALWVVLRDGSIPEFTCRARDG